MPETCLGLQASQWPRWSADPVLKGLTAHLLALIPVQLRRGSLPRAPGHCKLVLLLESSAHMCLHPTSSGPPKAGLEPSLLASVAPGVHSLHSSLRALVSGTPPWGPTP